MTDPEQVPPALTIRLVDAIGAVGAQEWDACLAGSPGGDDNPFLSHRFLSILEQSGSVGGDTGWDPRHLTVRDAAGLLLAVMPLYLKYHSYGEYVFDHGWADAFERAGGRYYPKLQSSVPFTPVTGPRLLVRAGAPPGLPATLIRALEGIAGESGLSGVHVTFAAPADVDCFRRAGWLLRLGTQFHWENRGYRGFDDFLASLSSRKRKAVRKERQAVAYSGVELLTLTGGDLREEHWAAFDRLYRATSDRKWGQPYLTRDFFLRLGADMADNAVLVMAREGGRWIGGALNLMGARTLYGRNWGGVGDHPFLHFEACYYRAIDFAIDHGLSRVEGGAQGEHKIQRGYLPVETWSAHYLVHPGLRRAVADFLAREREAMGDHIADLAAAGPYRRAGDGPI
ncbi:GNAT family N-acetyltransferase [Niveispirillum fermenti]|uniref:GNAT family N-acetyltransferase n=1 Tax=Niveispirillum fermenti TaxID=1233113 RepID=UPI003A86BD7C